MDLYEIKAAKAGSVIACNEGKEYQITVIERVSVRRRYLQFIMT